MSLIANPPPPLRSALVDFCDENLNGVICDHFTGMSYPNPTITTIPLQGGNFSHLYGQHMTRRGPELWSCNLCEYMTSKKDHLKTHLKGVHGNHQNLACPFCGKVFKNKNSLNNHKSVKHRDQGI